VSNILPIFRFDAEPSLSRTERAKMESLKAESRSLDARFEEAFKEELRSLAEAITNSSKTSEEAQSTAQLVHADTLEIEILTDIIVKRRKSWLVYDVSCAWQISLQRTAHPYLSPKS
jgi:hypothetical protein